MPTPQDHSSMGQLLQRYLPPTPATNSKLPLLQHLHCRRNRGYQAEPSQPCRLLNHRICATDFQCIGPSSSMVNCGNLVAFAYNLLVCAFADEIVMQIVLDVIKGCQERLIIMMEVWNPYSELAITAEDLANVWAEILLKINKLRVKAGIHDVLRDYYVALEAFSILVRLVLVKLQYPDAEDCRKKLEKTQAIYSMLCQYFDLNVMCKNVSKFFRQSHYNQPPQTFNRAKIFLFSNQNLFISTANNEQFCCGKYCNNETELTHDQPPVSASFLQVPQVEPIRRPRPNAMPELELDLKTSQFSQSSVLNLLNMHESNIISSNATTPEFGDAVELRGMRKSNDTFGSITLEPTRKSGTAEDLGTVEEELNDQNSPSSDKEKVRSSKILAYGQNNKEKDSSEFLFIKKYEPYTVKVCKKIETLPSTTSFDHELQHQKAHICKAFDKAKQRVCTEAVAKVSEKSKQKTFFKKQQGSLQTIKLYIPRRVQNGSEYRLSMQQKLRSSSKTKNMSLSKKCSLESDPNSRLATTCLASEHTMNEPKKRQNSSRKYSVNEVKRNSSKDKVMHQKVSVCYSNYRGRDNTENPLQKSRKSQLQINAPSEISKYDYNSETLGRKSKREMKFTSNIINVNIGSPKKFSPKKHPSQQNQAKGAQKSLHAGCSADYLVIKSQDSIKKLSPNRIELKKSQTRQERDQHKISKFPQFLRAKNTAQKKSPKKVPAFEINPLTSSAQNQKLMSTNLNSSLLHPFYQPRLSSKSTIRSKEKIPSKQKSTKSNPINSKKSYANLKSVENQIYCSGLNDFNHRPWVVQTGSPKSQSSKHSIPILQRKPTFSNLSSRNEHTMLLSHGSNQFMPSTITKSLSYYPFVQQSQAHALPAFKTVKTEGSPPHNAPYSRQPLTQHQLVNSSGENVIRLYIPKLAAQTNRVQKVV